MILTAIGIHSQTVKECDSNALELHKKCIVKLYYFIFILLVA